MATGTQSSQSLRPGFVPSTPQAATEILRSGEKVASTVEALNNPEARTFLNMVPNSNFVMPNGLVLQFLGGRYTTADAAEIAELEKVANKPASLIYTKAEAKQADEALAKLAASETLTSDGQTGKIEAAQVSQ